VKRLFVRRHGAGIDAMAVGCAVGVPKHKLGRDPTLDDELTSVQGSVMCPAEDGQVVGIVVAPVRAKHDVVDVKKRSMPTAWDDTPSAIPPHDPTPNGGGYILTSPG